ncbi:MAG: hypothetical protein WCB27_12180 [Thermoguttaceae bacterium]
MRLLLKLIVVLVICVVVIGFWRGWFSFSRTPNPDSDGNKTNFNVSVDNGKMKADLKKAEDKVEKKMRQLEGKK